jgi:hypothetical protein
VGQTGVRFLVVKLTHSGLNYRFNIVVTFTINYSFSGRQHLHQQRDVFDDRLRESQDQIDSVFQNYL